MAYQMIQSMDSTTPTDSSATSEEEVDLATYYNLQFANVEGEEELSAVERQYLSQPG